jgi:hypothetical protein
MTPEKRAALAAEIMAKCPELVAGRDESAIAKVLSVGRKRPNGREIGNGTILETLGIAAGNALLDAINGAADYRHVKPLIEQGRLLIGSQLVQVTVNSMAPAILTQAQADALCALGFDDDIVSATDVALALEGM